MMNALEELLRRFAEMQASPTSLTAATWNPAEKQYDAAQGVEYAPYAPQVDFTQIPGWESFYNQGGYSQNGPEANATLNPEGLRNALQANDMQIMSQMDPVRQDSFNWVQGPDGPIPQSMKWSSTEDKNAQLAALLAAAGTIGAVGAAGAAGGGTTIGAGEAGVGVMPEGMSFLNTAAPEAGMGNGAWLGAYGDAVVPTTGSAAGWGAGTAPAFAQPGMAAAPELSTVPSMSGLPEVASGQWISGIPNGLTANMGVNALGGVLGAVMANKAAGAQKDYGDRSLQLLSDQYNQTRADYAPYRQAGTSALAQIQQLLADPNAITRQPDYEFQRNEGLRAINGRAGSMAGSGAHGKALTRYGTDYAGTKLNESYNRLASIAGIGQQATQSGANLGANWANNSANTLEGQGNVTASGYIGAGNALAGGLTNAANNWQQNSMWQDWLRKQGGGG